MKSRRPIFLLIVALAAGVLWFQVILFSPSITGSVVDMQGRPVVGAVVVVDWSIHASLSNAPIGQLKMFEVVTNDNGHFRIPSWGMKTIVRGIAQQPVMRIFHPQYAPLIVEDVYSGSLGFLIPVYPQNGKTFVLEPVSLAAASRGHSFAHLYRSLFGFGKNVTLGGNCPKLSMPRMLAAMEQAPSNIINDDIPGTPAIRFRAKDVENLVPCHDGESGSSAISPAHIHQVEQPRNHRD